MKQHGFRLSTRITIGAIAIVVACILALMLIEEARLRDVYNNELRTDLQQSLAAEKLRLTQAINTLHQDVLFLSNTPPVSGIVRAALNRGHDPRYGYTSKVWEERLQQIFSAFSAAHPDYYQIRYIGVADGGRELVRVDNRGGKIDVTPPAMLQTKADRDYFKATQSLHAGEVYLSEFNLNRERGVIEQPYRPTLRAATPVFTPSGQFFGMVVVNMDMSHLLKSAASGLRAGVQSYITNTHGEYLLHPDSPRFLGFELGRKDKITTNFPFLKTIFIPRTSGHFLFQAVATGTGTQYWVAERIHFDAGDPARFLVLAYSVPDAVTAQQITAIPPEHIIAGFIAMLLASGIAFLALRRMFSPLEQITAAADKIAAGNHAVLLPQTGSGEIGSLANALGTMLAKVSQREQDILRINAELEERVRERTFELNNINELLHGIKGKKLLQETEKLLRRNQALMQTSMDGIHVLDIQGYIVTANDAFCRMLGYTQEEAARLNVADWETQFSIEELRARLRELIGKSVLTETLYRRKDGALINIEVSTSGVEIEGQDFIFSASRDITERKKIEEVIRTIEVKLRSIIDASPVTMALNDEQQNITFLNPAFVQTFGYTLEDIPTLADWWRKACPDPGYRQWVVDAWQITLEQAKRDGTPFHPIELNVRCNDGTVKTVLANAASMDKSFAGNHLVVLYDITERKKNEEALRVAAAAFETQDAILITDARANIIRINQAFSDITGYSLEEVLGRNPRILSSDRHDQAFYVAMRRQLMHTGEWAGEIWCKRRSGQIYPAWLNITAVKNEWQETTQFVAIFSDITLRKQAEEEILRESEERFRGTLEQAAVGIAHATLDGYFQQVNQKFCEIVGYARDEMIHMSFQDITFPADLGENIHYIQQLLAGEISTFSMEKRYVRKDKTLVWVKLTVSLLRDTDGTPKYTIGVIEDITGRKQSEALAQRFGRLLQNSFNEIYLFDANTLLFLQASEGAKKNLGYSSEELNQITPLDLKPSFTWESFELMVAPLRKGERESLNFETFHRRKDGTTYPVEIHLQHMDTDPGAFLAIIQDTTERKRAEQQLRDLTAHIQTVREEEKASVAREIHDDLGGILTALKMDTYWLARKLITDTDIAPLRERVESMSGLIVNAVGVTRRIITGLRPTILDDLGLLAALEWQAAQFSKRTGIECSVSCMSDGGCEIEVDKTQSINLFRIFQEALTNVARHSGASRVEVELQIDDKEISLSISDNGRGLTQGHAIASTSYGIRGMCERAEQLGGRVEYGNHPGGGLRVTVILPLLADNKKGGET